MKGKENISVHPEWSCNVKDNKDEVIGSQGYHDENWKRLTAERERKWGGKKRGGKNPEEDDKMAN